MVSRHEVIYCEHCQTPCFFDYEENRWCSDDKKPMFTGRHCSSFCYNSVLRELELEFTLNSEARSSIVRRLKMYKELDTYRCKECGSVSSWCHCMEWDSGINRTVFKPDVGNITIEEYRKKYIVGR